jgi:hypothetical protein
MAGFDISDVEPSRFITRNPEIQITYGKQFVAPYLGKSLNISS